MTNSFPLARVFIRTFFLQSAWNFERMQSVGFAFAVEPALKQIYGRTDSLRDALRRHLELFNTHPYLAGLLIGMTARYEEESAKAEPGKRDELHRRIAELKERMSGPLAAIGDGCFWSGLRTACALCAVLAGSVAMLWELRTQNTLLMMEHLQALSFLPAACFVLQYNAFALPMRFAMVRAGYQWGETCANEIAKFPVQRGISAIRRGSLFLLAGNIVCFAAVLFLTGKPGWLAALAVVPVYVAALRKGISVSKIFYCTLGCVALVRAAIRISG